MPYAPLRRTMLPLGRVFGVTPWFLAGGISASNCIGAYAAKGAASQAASYTNLANPGTYDLTLGVAPTWATGTGWVFGGTNEQLVTGITPGNSWTIIVRCTPLGNGGVSYGRVLSAAGPTYIGPRNADDRVYYFLNAQSTYKRPSLTADGVLAIAGTQAYRNAVADATLSGAPSSGGAVVIGNRPAGDRGFDGRVAAVAFYNTALDATTIATLTTAMNGL